MKLKKFITSTVVCALAVISLSGMSVSAAEAPTNEKSFTPLAPAGWNTSTTAQQIYGDAEQSHDCLYRKEFPLRRMGLCWWCRLPCY